MASKRCSEHMTRRGRPAKPPAIYNVDDEVLVQVQCKTQKTMKKCALKAIIVKRNLRLSKYMVRFNPLGKSGFRVQWISVEDIVAVARDEECRRRKSKKHNFRIPHTHKDLFEARRSSNCHVQLDPQPDGNCQFAALADQLRSIDIIRSARSLREEIVKDLQSNPQTTHGVSFSDFVEGPWNAYLKSMGQNGTYGDHITLQRASEMFKVRLLILSTLGPDATVLIAPSHICAEHLPLLILGHVAEGHGEHFVSLSGPISHQLNSGGEKQKIGRSQ